MNRTLKRWVVFLLLAACTGVGVLMLIFLRERNLANRRIRVIDENAEYATYQTMHCLSPCIDNYIIIHRAIPWSIEGEELWGYRLTPEDKSSFCNPRYQDNILAFRDGWGLKIKMEIGDENLLWLVSAGPDGVFQADYEAPYQGIPRNADNDNIDHIVPSSQILSSCSKRLSEKPVYTATL